MAILAAMAVPHPPLIMPEVGKGEEQTIQSTIDAYREVMRRAAELQPDTIVITSPHTMLYSDYFHISPGAEAQGDFGQFRAPQLQLGAKYDTELVDRLVKLCNQADLAAGTLGERHPELDHGTMIPLRFFQDAMQEAYGEERAAGVRLVRIGLSGLSVLEHYRLGQLIRQATDDLGRRAVFIASGDLSHKLKSDGPYGFSPDGIAFDARMQEVLREGDFYKLLTTPSAMAESAAECGLRSLWIMAGALDKRAVQAELLSYEGPFGVGYGVGWFLPGDRDDSRDFAAQYADFERQQMEQNREHEDGFVRLARHTLETYVKSRVIPPVPDDLPDELTQQRAGAFVSLKKEGHLRGCIGTIAPTRSSLAKEIMGNAIAAGTRDPRFESVTVDELPHIVYSVDVLNEPEPIDDLKKLDVRKYGVIVESNGRRGLLLPDLAGVDTVEQQIDIARRKGNIGPKEKVKLWRFTVTRHH